MAEKKYPSLASQKGTRTHEVYSLEKITLYSVYGRFFSFPGQHRKKHCIVRKQHTISLLVRHCQKQNFLSNPRRIHSEEEDEEKEE
jgi:hypothetical protein